MWWRVLGLGLVLCGSGWSDQADEEICADVFDISNRTIIKATESVGRGARFLGASEDARQTRWGCQSACCRTPDCNIAVFQENKDRDCYLFDCGTVADFRCVFSVHDNYIAMGMMIDRADLEKTRIHEQSKHEVDLNVMKVKNNVPEQYMPAVPEYRKQDAFSARAPAGPVSSNGDTKERQELAQMMAERRRINEEAARMRGPEPPPDPPRSSRVMDKTIGDVKSPFRGGQQQNPAPAYQPQPAYPQQPPPPPQRPAPLPRVAPPESQRKKCHSTYEWRCGSGECIPVYDVCTGIAQCVDGSDEGQDMCRRRLENIQAARRAEAEKAKSAPVQATGVVNSAGSMAAAVRPGGSGRQAPVSSGGVVGGRVGGGSAGAGHKDEGLGTAGVVLGLGIVILAVFLLFICVRFRSTPRVSSGPRKRRGKSSDPAEADGLMNGMYL